MPEGFWANKGHWRGRFWTMGGKNSAGWLFPAVEDRFPLRNVHVVETRIRGIHEKSEKCHHIWNLKNYITHSAHRDKWLHWHQPSTVPDISASQNINWVDKRWRYGGNFLFICFVPCFLFLTSKSTVLIKRGGSRGSTVFINQDQFQTETFLKFFTDIPYFHYIINDLSDHHNGEEFVLAPTWNQHCTPSWLHK